jgi:hypothetical protein
VRNTGLDNSLQNDFSLESSTVKIMGRPYENMIDDDINIFKSFWFKELHQKIKKSPNAKGISNLYLFEKVRLIVAQILAL